MDKWIEWLKTSVWGGMPELSQGMTTVVWLFAIGFGFAVVLWLFRQISTDPKKIIDQAKYASLALVCILLGPALIIGAIGALLQFLSAALDFQNESHEAIRNIGLVLAAVFGAPFIAWRSYVAHKQAAISEQSHITEQINKAVEGLGAEKVEKEYHAVNLDSDDPSIEIKVTPIERTVPNIEVRIGAIYALERIAQDSPRDHVQIMEIMTAYVRENSKADSAVEIEEQRPSHPAFRGRIQKQLSNHPIRIDIQIAMTVIGRRRPRQIRIEQNDPRYGEGGYKIDLSYTNLQSVILTGLNFQGAIFKGAVLDGANLRDTDLEQASFFEASLIGAFKLKANLRRAFIFKSDLRGAHLELADMKGVTLTGSRVEGAVFTNADLRNANLATMKIDHSAKFDGAKVAGADIRFVSCGIIKFSQHQLEKVFSSREYPVAKHRKQPDHWPAAGLSLDEYRSELHKWRASPDTYTPPPPSDAE